MKNYDAERYDINGRWFKYRTGVFYKVHKEIASFKHRTAIGGVLGTMWRVKLHKLAKQTKD